MEQAGSHDETDPIGQGVGGARKLRAMRMAMEDREHAHDDGGGPEGHAQAGRHRLEQAIPATAVNAAPAIKPGLNLLVDRLLDPVFD